MYKRQIVKVTKVVTIVEGKSKSTRGTEETKYKQSLYGKIINGEDKGKEVRIANEYTTTEMADQKYHKGDRVFLVSHFSVSVSYTHLSNQKAHSFLRSKPLKPALSLCRKLLQKSWKYSSEKEFWS